MVRRSWAVRLAACAVLAGLLIQFALAVPARLAMVQVAPVCTASHGGGARDIPDRPSHDHDHCLLCQCPAGPPLLAAAALVPPPLDHTAWVDARVAAASFVAAVATGFLSRAPPVLV